MNTFTKSKKYEHIESVLDTGHSLSKHLKKLSEKAANYKYRENELFKRIKPATLAKLMFELSLEYDLFGNNTEEDKHEETEAEPPVQTHLQNFSVSHLPIEHRPKQMKKPKPQVPVLLLDVRSLESYHAGHLLTAQHYSPHLLLRGDYQFTKEILTFKNQMNKLIIIYDADESQAAQVAQQFCEREFRNVWILSGGLKVFLSLFQGLFEGKYKDTFLASISSTSLNRPSTSLSTVNRSLSRMSISSVNKSLPQPRKSSPIKIQPQEPPVMEYKIDLDQLEKCLQEHTRQAEMNDRSTFKSFSKPPSTAGAWRNINKKPQKGGLVK